MLKFIGAITVIGGVALGVAVWTGNLDFHTTANLTPKGNQSLSDARDKVADAIRGAGESAASATKGE